MGFYDNIYYDPEKFGVSKVAEFDLDAPDYSFDLLVAWRDDSGFYLGTDSGCSCPSPFENYEGKQDLTGPLTVEQAVDEARSIRKSSYRPGYDPQGFKSFISAIKESK